MKKLTLIILLGILGLNLSGCMDLDRGSSTIHNATKSLAHDQKSNPQ